MGTRLNKNYMVVVESGLLSTILIFDKVRMCIVQLEQGRFKDITEDCFKLTKKKNKVIGGLWYQFLHNEIDSTSACIWEDKIMFHTDNENEVDMFLLETRVKQLKFMLENAETYLIRYQGGKQAYTYKHCEK
jgi:hypothetical protein